MKHFDAIVIGAGIAGAATTFFLRERGISVALVERTHPAGGPTAKSSAITHAFHLMPELSQLAIRGREILCAIPELTGEGPVHTQVGMMWACGRSAKEDWLAAARRIRQEGATIEDLSPAELADRYPGITLDGIDLALWEPAFGYADPYGTTNALVNGARQRGAEVFLSASVRNISLSSSGKVKGVELKDGSKLSADLVIVAAGPWTKALVAAAGYDLPIFAERHEMAVLEAAGRAREFMPFSWCDDVLCSYARPDGDRVVLVGIWAGGGTAIRNQEVPRDIVPDLESYREDVSEDESAAILAQLVPRFPNIAQLGIRPGYAALYDMSPDDNPIIGKVPRIEGLYVVCGSSGHGFKIGSAVGEEVARLVATGTSRLLAPFSVERFK